MKLKKVLIIYKKSTYQLQVVEHKESRFIKLLNEKHEAVTRVKVAHDEHYDVLEIIKSELKKRSIDFKALAREELKSVNQDFDLIISVGGDGTFLDASHFARKVPLVGVNSSKSSSFGHFCIAKDSSISQVLDQIESDKLKPIPLLRLGINLNGEELPELVLNEVLICHTNPAGTSRYFIEIDNKKEEQKSGGIWIGPPSGSTGSIRAAHGKVLPILDKQYQYIVREPGPRPKEQWQLIKGLLSFDKQIKITSQMRTGAIYIDGSHIQYDLSLGDVIIIRSSDDNLMAYVDPNVNDIFSS